MRLLTFQVKRFWWQAFSKTLEDVPDQQTGQQEVQDAVVVFLQAEREDEGTGRKRVFAHTLKHIKWLANKRGFKNVVLHSFAHLGGESASAAFANEFIEQMKERLTTNGYEVHATPFGYFCEWTLDVYGESMAKVYKRIEPKPPVAR